MEIRIGAFVLLGAVLCASGCSNRPATAPSAPTSPGAVASNASPTHVSGLSEDSAFRPLSGVRIEIVDGPQAGASVVTGDNGLFEFASTLIRAVTLRATKDGFASETRIFTWVPASERQLYTFTLEPLGPSLALEPGDYTVTITGDRASSSSGAAACNGFPDDLLTRRYAATVVPRIEHPHTEFSVTLQLNNPAPISSSLGFGMGIAGNVVGFTIDGPAIGEVLPNYTYLEIDGSAPTDAPATSTGMGIAIPFSGSFEYCALRSPMGVYNNCFTAPEKIAYAQCLSTRDLMVFTRR